MCDHCGRDEDEEKDRKRFLIGAGWLTGIFSIGVFFALTAFFIDGSEKAGQFGDSFGWVNAALSTVTAAGAIYAVIMQGRELKLAREEALLARREAAASARAQQSLVELQARVAVRSTLQQKFEEKRQRIARIKAGKDEEMDFFYDPEEEGVGDKVTEIGLEMCDLYDAIKVHDGVIESLLEEVSEGDPEAY